VRPAFAQGGGRYIPDKKKPSGKHTRQPSQRGRASAQSTAQRGKSASQSTAQRGKSASQSTAQRGKSAVQSVSRSKKTKFDRIFGEDASRIRREAAQMSERGGAKRQKSTKNTQKQFQKSKKR